MAGVKKGLEKIFDVKQLLAVIFRANIQINEVEFLTESSNDFQIGIHNRKKGIKLTPHTHKFIKAPQIKTIQELLLVQSGRIRVNIYNKKSSLVSKKILKRGDGVLLITGGHGVDFLEDSRVFQVKQGPFSGTIHQKIFIK